MATSGIYSFNLTRDEIITEALIQAGMFDPESSSAPTATQLSQGSKKLNSLTKAWQADGLQIWVRKIGIVFLQPDQATYQLGSSGTVGGDEGSLEDISTTLSASASSGATTITVDDITFMASADRIGIQLDDDTMFWTTINGAPSGSTVTLTSGTTGTATSGNAVYAYTTKLARPIRANDGYIRQANGRDSPVRLITFEEYNRFGNKTSTGTPTQVFFKPELGFSNVTLYPVPNISNIRLFIELHYPFQDFNSGTDNPDFPQEWLNALIWQLSVELGYGYGVTESRLRMMEARAEYWHQLALSTSQENSVYISPDPFYTWGYSDKI